MSDEGELEQLWDHWKKEEILKQFCMHNREEVSWVIDIYNNESEGYYRCSGCGSRVEPATYRRV